MRIMSTRYFMVALPTLLFTAALIFRAGHRDTRSMMATYVGVVVFAGRIFHRDRAVGHQARNTNTSHAHWPIRFGLAAGSNWSRNTGPWWSATRQVPALQGVLLLEPADLASRSASPCWR